MSERSALALRGRNPDVLTCIANLSNDEVFTPPELANRMLDGIAEAWAGSHDGDNIRAGWLTRRRSGDPVTLVWGISDFPGRQVEELRCSRHSRSDHVTWHAS